MQTSPYVSKLTDWTIKFYGTSGKFYIRFQRICFLERSPQNSINCSWLKFTHNFLVLVNLAGRNKKQLRVGNNFFQHWHN